MSSIHFDTTKLIEEYPYRQAKIDSLHVTAVTREKEQLITIFTNSIKEKRVINLVSPHDGMYDAIYLLGFKVSKKRSIEHQMKIALLTLKVFIMISIYGNIGTFQVIHIKIVVNRW